MHIKLRVSQFLFLFKCACLSSYMLVFFLLSKLSMLSHFQKLPAKPAQKIVLNKRVKGGLPYDVSALSDGDLARQLKSFGATIGPITDSTRVLYQKKLGKSVA